MAEDFKLGDNLIENQDFLSLTERLISPNMFDEINNQEGQENVKVYDYEKILQRVGGFEGCLIYSFSFLTLMPDYQCNDGTGFFQCDREQTCEYKNQDILNFSPSSNEIGYSINWETRTSLNNLVEHLSLRCVESWEIGFMGSCYFIGAVFGNLFLSRLGDTVGRILMVRIGISLSLLLYAVILFVSTSLLLNYALVFLFGCLTSFRVGISYLYGQEIVRAKHSNMIGSLYNIFDSITMIMASLYYKYISDDYIGIHLVFFVFILSSALISFTLPESPKFLISVKKYKEARQALNTIAEKNGKKKLSLYNELIKDEIMMNRRRRLMSVQIDEFRKSPGNNVQNKTAESVKSQKLPNHSIYNLIQNRLYLLNLVLMSITWASSTFTYYMVGFYIKYIPGDIFNMVIVSSMAELFACLISGVVSGYVGTKKCLFSSFLMGGVFGILIIFISPSNTLMISFCLLLTKFGVSSAFNLCFLVTAEYFPTLYSSTVFGACNVFARIMSIFSPLIAEVPAPLPMMVYTCFCFMSMLGTTLLVKHQDQDNKIDDILSKGSSPGKRERDFDQELD
ncbi:organic cation [Stylonychia lemnae]|uniref:Organic cation n=1 Tax=Stylonychia lemnae TaxID=5949 RepID=A0A078AHJ5_STYLE|nr:organic cation [Stylonychia lemnae]|eukprot:CDW80967.1 organic cation [Stylonychia lemnae]